MSLLLGKHVVGLIVETKDFRIAVKHTDMSVSRELMKNGSYSTIELIKLKSMIAEESNVLIIGGHLGAIAIPLASLAYGCYVFEANPDTFKLLETSIAINKLSNLYAFNLAVGEKNGNIDFLKSRVFSGGAKRLPLFNKGNYTFDNPEIQSVPMISIDNFEPLNDIKINVCVIDIEGSEFFALKGMQGKLAQGIDNLIVEFIPHHINNVGGCTISEFCNLIIPYYNYFKLSSSDNVYSIQEAESKLTSMFNNNEGDEGIHFFK